MAELKYFLLCVLVGSLEAAHLRDLTDRIYIGTAMSHDYVNESIYLKITAEEFNMITTENALKWADTEPEQDQYSYGDADDIIAFAEKNNQSLRGHTFIWHRSIPSWANSLDTDTLRTSIRNKIIYELTRYKGKMYAWDVVNEVFTTNGTLRTDNIFYQNFGESYIIDAFKLARETDPSVKLYINDYAIEGINDKSNGLYNFVKRLLSEGVPIDGVGFQAHLNIGNDSIPALYADVLFELDPTEFEQNLKRFIDLGIEVAVTELDVGTYGVADDTFYQRQAEDFASVYRICKSIEKCKGVTTWNWSDKYSYAPNRDSDLWDLNVKPKPALKAVKKALKSGK